MVGVASVYLGGVFIDPVCIVALDLFGGLVLLIGA